MTKVLGTRLARTATMFWAAFAIVLIPAPAQDASLVQLDIFPPQELHVHGSSIVELPNGDLLAGWFQGTGERTADDVVLMGARLPKGAQQWTAPFLMADTPGFPDFTPLFVIDGKERLWMIWYTVLAHQWESSMLKYRLSSDYQQPEGPPVWAWQDVLHVKPGGEAGRGIQPDDPFAVSVEQKLADYVAYLKTSGQLGGGPDAIARVERQVQQTIDHARGRDMVRRGEVVHDDGTTAEAELGYPYYSRMGWQTRHKPVILEGGRMIVPLYSDGFDFSLMAITDNWGETWEYSEPLVGFGNIQPSIAMKADGTLVAYMRDNGPAPKRLHRSESKDRGLTWGPVRDTELPNPGSGADIVTLANGHWLLIYNDTEEGRHSLAVSLSMDGGETWPHTRHLALDSSGAFAFSSHYPAIIQGRDGVLHATYTSGGTLPGATPDAERIRVRTIKYARFTEDWVRAPEARAE
jgi:predicted neuraminidase